MTVVLFKLLPEDIWHEVQGCNMRESRRCGETGLDLFHRVIVQGGSALDPATIVRQPRSYTLSLISRLNCSVDDAASTPLPAQKSSRRWLIDCLKQTAVADLVAAGAAVSAEAPRFLAAFGPSVDGRTVRNADLRGRMSDRGRVDGGKRSVFDNVSLLVGLSADDGVSRLTQTELDVRHSNNEAELNRKRRTMIRTFVRNIFTFHRQTIADILLHQV